MLLALAVPRPASAQDRDAAHAAMIARIADAKRQLATARIGTTSTGGDNAVLAVYDPSAPARGVRIVQVLAGRSRTRGFDVTVTLRNGVNSQYEVRHGGDAWQVLAIRTNVRDGRRRTRPAVYVPYSPGLHTPEMERDGRRYLETLIADARRRLVADRAPSHVDASRMAPDLIPDRVLLALMVIEHVDPDDFAAHGAEWSANRVFVTVALNGGEAYRYAGSYAGAYGLAQFIRGTYLLTRTRYPAAGLPADFREGMANHAHATRAQFCLADWSLTTLPDADRTRLLRPANVEAMGAFLAAAYNGGEVRAARAYEADSTRWELAGNGLASQTVTYVREFRATYRFLGR